jgi:hypothetical protein
MKTTPLFILPAAKHFVIEFSSLPTHTQWQQSANFQHNYTSAPAFQKHPSICIQDNGLHCAQDEKRTREETAPFSSSSQQQKISPDPKNSISIISVGMCSALLHFCMSYIHTQWEKANGVNFFPIAAIVTLQRRARYAISATRASCRLHISSIDGWARFRPAIHLLRPLIEKHARGVHSKLQSAHVLSRFSQRTCNPEREM